MISARARARALALVLKACACAPAAEEAPRAPIALGATADLAVPGPGHNLVRNGSFEGSTKYACEPGEWRDPAAFPVVDDTTAAVGASSALLPRGGGIQIAPFRCKPATLYCLSFYAKGEGDGDAWELGARVRGMHYSDNDRWNEYPGMRGDATLTRTWKRFAMFFPATRLDLQNGVVNSYYAEIWAGHAGRWWIDGVQVEEVAGVDADRVRAMKTKDDIPATVGGYPGPFVLAAPVEVCAEDVDPPDLRLYAPGSSARVRAAIVNGPTPRTVSATWTLLDHRQRTLWTSSPQQHALAAGEAWRPVVEVPLARKGAMLVRVSLADGDGYALNFSDEPVTALPFDNTAIGSDFAERFGITLSFWDPGVADADNLGLRLFRRLGFRWARNSFFSSWSETEPEPGKWSWDKLVGSARFAHEHGFRQYVLLQHQPRWALAAPNDHNDQEFPRLPAKDQADWAWDDPRWDDLTIETAHDRYVKALIERCRGLVDAYEFGNETTIDPPSDPRIVWRLDRRAAKLVRSLDPGAKIIGVNTLWTKTAYWGDVLALGGLDDMDFFGWDFDCYGVGGSGYGDIDALRRLMREKAGREIPTFNYESGWGSGWMQDYVADPIGGARIDYGVIPDEMAKCFARIFAAGTEHFVLHLTAYPRNLMGSYWSCTRWPTQIYDEQERPRVTLAPYDVAIAYLGLSTPIGLAGDEARRVEAYGFHDRRGDRPIVALWATDDAADDRALRVAFPGAVIAADVMGNDAAPRRDGDAWLVPLRARGAVTYLIGERGADGAALMKAIRGR